MIQKSHFPQGIISNIHGRAFVLDGDDIDTDRIIPARFLKCVSFDSLGESVFADDRIELKGAHPFDNKKNLGAKILIVNDNFGCGSSREHAPQALMRWGVRGIIGQSFAEIFHGNCLALGIPCATCSANDISRLKTVVNNYAEESWELNIKAKTLISEKGDWKVNIDAGSHEMLLTGRWDATSQLVSNQNKVKGTMRNLPYLNNFQSQSE